LGTKYIFYLERHNFVVDEATAKCQKNVGCVLMASKSCDLTTKSVICLSILQLVPKLENLFCNRSGNKSLKFERLRLIEKCTFAISLSYLMRWAIIILVMSTTLVLRLIEISLWWESNPRLHKRKAWKVLESVAWTLVNRIYAIALQAVWI